MNQKTKRPEPQPIYPAEKERKIGTLEAVEAVGAISPLVILAGVGIALILFFGLTCIVLYLLLSGAIGGGLQPLRTEPLFVSFERGTESFWQVEKQVEPRPDQEPLVLRQSAFINGQYRLVNNVPNGLFWTTAGVTLGPGIYEVDITFGTRDEGSGAGIMLSRREEDGSDQFLLYQIDPDGFVWLGLCQNGCATATPLTGGGWYAVEAIDRSPNATNRLKLLVKDGELVAYVNDIQVGYVFNWRVSGVGDVGFLVESSESGGVSADFDNFSWNPHRPAASAP